MADGVIVGVGVGDGVVLGKGVETTTVGVIVFAGLLTVFVASGGAWMAGVCFLPRAQALNSITAAAIANATFASLVFPIVTLTDLAGAFFAYGDLSPF